MNALQELFARVSGPEEQQRAAPGISAEELDRLVRAQQAVNVAPKSTAGAFSGAYFQDLLLNLGDSKWDAGAEQRFGVQGYSLFMARDGSAPDAVVVVNTGFGPVRLSPGSSFRGAFDGFTARLFGKRRNVTRHDARLVVGLAPEAVFEESPQALARFHPVPLFGGDRMLGEAGAALVGGATGTIYPQGFSKMLVELTAGAGTFGANEVFTAQYVTRPLLSTTLPSVVWNLGNYSATVTNVSGRTGLAVILDVPEMANDPNEPQQFSGAGSSSYRQGVVLTWTGSGTASSVTAWVSGVK